MIWIQSISRKIRPEKSKVSLHHDDGAHSHRWPHEINFLPSSFWRTFGGTSCQIGVTCIDSVSSYLCNNGNHNMKRCTSDERKVESDWNPRFDDVTPDTASLILFFFFYSRWGILFSHPRDYTPVCTTELGRAARLGREFSARDVKMIALSIDCLEDHHGWTKVW